MDEDTVIYKQGKSEGEKRIDPKILEILALDDLAIGLNKVVAHLKKDEFIGDVYSTTLNATDEIKRLDIIKISGYLWIKASLINDGPDTVYLGINSSNCSNIVKIDESFKIDFAKSDRRINYIWYKCDNGGTSSVRVVGKY